MHVLCAFSIIYSIWLTAIYLNRSEKALKLRFFPSKFTQCSINFAWIVCFFLYKLSWAQLMLLNRTSRKKQTEIGLFTSQCIQILKIQRLHWIFNRDFTERSRIFITTTLPFNHNTRSVRIFPVSMYSWIFIYRRTEFRRTESTTHTCSPSIWFSF